jgi:mRNA-degrading endonuclease YafQ of YafQ-DinJ toxin-antitoxin module
MLRNHPLQKPMIGMRAISAGEDLRIVFRKKRVYSEVLILDV